MQCCVPCCRKTWEINNLNVEVDYTNMRAQNILPLCSNCGAVSRPNIFMFGDTTESYIWETAHQSSKHFKDWRKKNLHKKVLLIEIGVGAEGTQDHVKHYYRVFPNATLIRINPQMDSSYPTGTIQIHTGAMQAFMNIFS